MTAAPKRLGYEDLVRLGEGRHHEIVAGMLDEKASPSPAHGRAQRSLAGFVGGPFDDEDGRGGPGGWWILTEVEVALAASDIVRPDLVGYRRERLPHPDLERPIRLAPDWICEIVSVSDARRDRVVKADLYAAHGVPFYWLVSPEERVLEAYELERAASGGQGERRKWVRLGAWGDGEVARIAPFEAIELEVGRVFLPRRA